MTEPVVLPLIGVNGILHTLREWNFVVDIDDFFRAFDNPCKDALARIGEQVLSVVFNIAVALNLGVERNDNQSTPDTGIGSAYLRQMVGVQNEGMARRKAERVFVLFLRKDIVRGAELLDDGVVYPVR